MSVCSIDDKFVDRRMPSLAIHAGFAAHSVRTNPWTPHVVAICAADNFGVSGTGKVYLVSIGAPGGAGAVPPGVEPSFHFMSGFGTVDGAFDAAFSETTPNIIVVAQGDGLRLYDTTRLDPYTVTIPIAAPVGHTAEVVSVDWSPHKTDQFVSSSWDTTVKLWSGSRLDAGPIMTFAGHMKEVYEAQYHPRTPALIASCSGDGTWRLWDTRSNKPGGVACIPGHGMDQILSLDWSRYETNLLCTGSVDRTVKLWDLRRPQEPLLLLRGHDRAVRRVRFSPHSRTLLATTGYDYRAIVWDLSRRPQYMTHRYEQHREFVVGCEWSLPMPGVLITAGWDSLVFAFTVGRPPTATHLSQGPLPPCVPPPRPPHASRMIRRGSGPVG